MHVIVVEIILTSLLVAAISGTAIYGSYRQYQQPLIIVERVQKR